MYYEIDVDKAREAHNASSMREFSAQRETDNYREQVDEAYRIAESQAKAHPEVAEKAYYLADKFARKYAAWLNESYRIESMCQSILIAGGGNFPTKKKERQNARRKTHMEEFERVMGIKRRIGTLGTGGIQSGDKNAIERLEAKAKSLEERQDVMKRANAFYRKHGSLEGFESLGVDESVKTMSDMKRFNLRQPFPSWELSNNRANIRRTRDRIEQLKREKEARQVHNG